MPFDITRHGNKGVNMKTNNQIGFTHNVALVVLGVMIMGVIGFAGMKVLAKNNSLKAAAATAEFSFQIGSTTSYAKVYVCKFKNTWFGTWKLRSQTYNSSNQSFIGGGFSSGTAYWSTSAGKLAVPNASARSWSGYAYSSGQTTEKLIIINGKPIPEC